MVIDFKRKTKNKEISKTSEKSLNFFFWLHVKAIRFLIEHTWSKNKNLYLPFNAGNKGGENCDVIWDARCGGKNNGGVFLVVVLPSNTGRNPAL